MGLKPKLDCTLLEEIGNTYRAGMTREMQNRTQQNQRERKLRKVSELETCTRQLELKKSRTHAAFIFLETKSNAQGSSTRKSI